MNKEKENGYSISFWGFITIIFLTVYAIANSEQVYYQMGYAAITYILIAAALFFIPYSFIVAEMSSAFKDRKGGIYSWMAESVSEKFGLVGTLIWYGAFVVMWFSASTICVSLSVALFGKDTTSTWHIFGLSSAQTLAIIGVIYIVIASFLTTRGLKSISFLSNISMLTIIIIHIIIIGGGIILFVKSGFKFAESFDYTKVSSYFYGPNKDYASFLPALSFMVFSIFTFAGMETSCGLVDQVKDAKKNVPKAIIVSTIIITALYILVILILGVVCNWNDTFGKSGVNLANYSVYIYQQEFYRLGTVLGLSQSSSIALGEWVNRILRILTLIGLTSVPIRIYTPIKHMFEGLPEGMIPKSLQKLNKNNMPANAILFQTCIIVFFIMLLGFGGDSVSALFDKMTLMTFVSGTVPISFIIYAYIKFKLNDNIKKDYEFFSKKGGIIWGSICFAVVTFTNIFSIIEPALNGNLDDTFWVALGPVLFGVLALILYKKYEKSHENIGDLKHSPVNS